MPPVGRTRFVRACRDADPETVAGFVAALYEARGWTVERTADRELTATRDAHSQRVAVRPTGVDAGGSVDVVVAPDAGAVAADVRTLDYGELHRQVSYAVDRGTATDLLGMLGLDPDATTGSTPPGSDGGAGRDGDRRAVGESERAVTSGTGTQHGAASGAAGGRVTLRDTLGSPSGRTLLLAVVVGAAVVLGVAVVVGNTSLADDGPPAAWQSVAQATPGAAASEPSTVPTEDAHSEPPSTPTGGPAVSEESLVESPPGVGRNGSVDPDRLVRAHRAVVANTSFTMTLTVQEFVDGRAASTYAETVRVADGAYSATVLRAGDQRYARPRVVGVDAYDNGTVRFSMVEGTVHRDASAGVAPVLNGSARLLGRHLSAEGTTLEDVDLVGGTRLYRLSTTADRLPGVANATGTVYVTREGVVRFARWSYVPRLGGGRVVVTWQVTDVGETAVTRPAWLPGERDA